MFTAKSKEEPDPTVILMVGPDAHGHWLVQERQGALEGSFVSREAALRFARWERHAYPSATIAMADGPLTSRLAA